MWKKKVKNNKLQYTLIGVMIMVSVSVFTLCWCFLSEFSTFAMNVLTEENSSDVYLVSHGSGDLLIKINDEDVKSNIEGYESFEGTTISKPIVYEDKDITLFNQMMIGTDNISDMEEFEIVESENNHLSPEKGEVWVPQILAKPNGISIGDEITINYATPIKLRVSGIYTAKLLLTSNLAFGPVLVNTQEFENLKRANSESDMAIFQINLKNNTPEAVEQLRDSYPYNLLFVTRAGLMESFISSAALLGTVGTIASILIFFFTMLIMRYVINILIKKELKCISLYKSMGYRNKVIRKIYARGLMVIGGIAIIIGAIIPLNFIEPMGKSASQYATGFKVSEVTYSMAVVSVVLFLVILYVTVRLSLRKTNKMSVTDIMHIGKSYGKRKMPQPLLKNVRTSFGMAVNDIWRHKIVNSLLVVTFVFSTYMAMFFSMVGYSAITMTDNGNLWFGIPKSNTYVMGDIDKEVREKLNKSEEIDTYVYGNLHYSVPLESEQVKNGLNNVTFDIMSDRRSSITGVPIVGDTPVRDNEVVLTKKALELFDVKVGDTINLKINNKERALLITGKYDTLFSDYGIMMSPEAMKESVPEYRPYIAFITLKDLGNFTKFSTDIQNEFSNLTVEKNWTAIDNAMVSIKEMLLGASVIITIAIMLLIVISISIVLLIEGTERRREYGIMKAFGFTNGFIIRKVLLKNITIASFGIGIGLIFHLLFSKQMLAMRVIDAFVDAPILLFGIIILLVFLTLSITMFITASTKKISTVELMEE